MPMPPPPPPRKKAPKRPRSGGGLMFGPYDEELEASGYLITRFLGEGSYGKVFAAEYYGPEHEDASPSVALKRIALERGQTNDGDGVPVSLVREASLLKRVSGHPNIAEIQNVLFRPHAVYLVLELCTGGDLAQFIKGFGDQYVPTATARSFTRQILGALGAMHALRFAHRDLKPSNVLLSADLRTVKLCDFGMARAFTASGEYTPRCTTSWYAPPEMSLGETRYDPTKADTWGAGCVLFELLCSQPAFACNTELEVLIWTFKNLGTPTPLSWPGVEKLPDFNPQFPQWRHQPAEGMLSREGRLDGMPRDLVEVLNRSLFLYPGRRGTARELLGMLLAPAAE